MFQKLRVLEFASVLAGPSVGQFFAELGAEVIKVENPRTNGDITRSWLFHGEESKNGQSAYFSSVNWGKKSILLDIQADGNESKLEGLILNSDIVITSFKPGDDKKLKLDYDRLKSIKADVICGHITGYGQHDQRVGYDAVIQAEAGFMSINGERDGKALKMPVALMDILAAHHLKEGLLLALIKKVSSGEGSYVPVSLLDSAVSSLVNQGSNWLVGGMKPKRTGNEHPNISPYGDVFETADAKQIILAVGSDRQFTKLCEILGGQLDAQEEFSTNALRVKNRKRLNSELSKSISALESAPFLESLKQQKVPVGLIKNIDEVLSEGPSEWFHNESGLQGIRNFVGIPDGVKLPKLSPPPKLGEHTNEVLNALL